MADDYLIDETEYSNGKDEEDPILVAQRYLNIFHQIHIFNANKKAEFDQALLSMPEKIKGLMPTIPGGRVLLEHIKELEENQGISSGETSELIAKNIEEEKKSIDNLKPHSASGSGELTLSSDFAESLATSLASALQSNNVASSGNGMSELASMLNKSFNAYTASMQNLTAHLIQRNTASPVQSQVLSAVTPATQQNLQNNNSTTVNNINFDTSYLNAITQALKENDNNRHEDMMQIVSALNKNLSMSGLSPLSNPAVSTVPTTTTNSVSEISTIALANSITEALKENNSQQMETIKAFGELLVQAFTQSQQELAQTLAQSTPRHTVKVVVSQDVDVEDQTNTASSPKTPNTPTALNMVGAQTQTKPESKKEKNNILKNFSDKINETTSKLTKNISQQVNNKAPQESLLNKINKSLNKINELKKQSSDNNSQNKLNTDKKIELKSQSKPEPKVEPKPQPQPKPEPKVEPKPQPQSKPEPKVEPKPQPQSKPEPKVEPKPQPQPKPEPKVEPKPQPQPKPEPKVEPKPQPQPKPEPKVEPKPQPQPKPEPKVEPKPQPQSKPEPKTQFFNDVEKPSLSKSEKTLNIDDILADIPVESDFNLDDTPDIFSDNSFSAAPKEETPAETNAPFIPSETEENGLSNSDDVNMAPKPQLHSYENALLKIKNALSSDDNVSLNHLDVKPVSLNGNEDKYSLSPQDPPVSSPFAKEKNDSQNTTNVSETSQNDEWEYVDENGNPVNNDDGEWEYVDENGNPVNGDDGEWEYVDENGNPVNNDDGEWEYVDENGNPVNSDDGEWEYVDENGNPVNSDDGEWEYVDENGNPLPSK